MDLIKRSSNIVKQKSMYITLVACLCLYFWADPDRALAADTWAFIYGNTWSDGGAHVVPISDGYIMTGTTQLSDGTDSILTIVKLDADGQIIWQKAYINIVTIIFQKSIRHRIPAIFLQEGHLMISLPPAV